MRSQMWDNKSTRANCDYSFHMAITWWGEQVFNEMETVVRERGINTFKHFMAYKGALMVNDDELFASFQRCAELGAIPLVHAENGDVVAELSGAGCWRQGNTGPEAHAYSPPAAGRGRGDQPRDHDRRHGGRAALCRAHLLRGEPRGDPPGAAGRASGSGASR